MIRVCLLLLVFLLTSCHAPSLVAPTTSVHAPSVSPAQSLGGQVEWPAARTTQALITDVASASVVSIIDVTTGYSVGATVTDAAGNFTIPLGANFKPNNNQAYYVEVSKGLQLAGSGQFNQAGADAVRLRTLVFFDATAPGWKSFTSLSGPIIISTKTTALAVGLALKQQAGQAVTFTDYVNAIPGNGTYAPPSGGIAVPDFNTLNTTVGDALAQDRDPVQYTTYDANTGSYSSTFVGFAVTDVQPRSGGINSTITITGSGFDSGALTVAVNGIAATITSFTSDTIVAKVGPGSHTGPVSVTIGGVLQAGPTFSVNTTDGHTCMLNGKLYVVSPSWGTLSEVAANGDVRTVVTGLGSPQQVAVGPTDGMLYVAARTDNAVWKIDPGNGFAKTSFASVTSAYGLAFDPTGNLCVSSNQSAGSVVKLSPTASVLATYTGFTSPTSLAFDYSGNLFVVGSGGAITRVAPNGTTTPWPGITDARGIAIDPAANLYVASNVTGTIYRIDPSGNTSVFAMINSPTGITLDSAGNMFVTNNVSNLIYRFSPSGNLLTYAYGIANARGLAVDPVDGTVYVSLGQSNAILKVNPADGILKKFVTGIANPDTLTWRGTGMYLGQPDVNNISFVDRTGQMSTVVTGVPWASGADQAADGRVYTGVYDTSVTRADQWQPNRDPIYNGRFGIVDTSGNLTWRYPYVSGNTPSSFLAVDAPNAGTQHLYVTSQGGKTLTMTTVALSAGTTNTAQVQKLFTFTGTPMDVTYDSSGNLYVAVQGENKVYRFSSSGGYAATGLTGFNAPYGLTIDGNGVLWVSNQGDGTLRKVSTPASATKADESSPGIPWTAAIPTALATPTHVTGIAAQSGTSYVYLTCDAHILQYDSVGNAFTDYLGYTLGNNVKQIWVRSTGVMYTRDFLSQSWFTINADKTNTAWNGSNYGGVSAFDPNFNRWESSSYGAQIWALSGTTNSGNNGYLGALGLTHEVAIDQANNYLYLASQGTTTVLGGGSGGIFRYDLTGASPKELYISIGNLQTAHSLAIDSSGKVYAGCSNGQIYLVDLSGNSTSKWSIGGSPIPVGLDLYANNQLWVAGSDSKVYDIPTGGSTVNTHLYGFMGPTL